MKKYRKFIVAAVGLAAIVVPILTTADLSTWQGVYAAVLAVLTAVGVHQVPNAQSHQVVSLMSIGPVSATSSRVVEGSSFTGNKP